MFDEEAEPADDQKVSACVKHPRQQKGGERAYEALLQGRGDAGGRQYSNYKIANQS